MVRSSVGSQALEEQQKAAVEAAEAKQKAGLFRVELVPPLHIDQDVLLGAGYWLRENENLRSLPPLNLPNLREHRV